MTALLAVAATLVEVRCPTCDSLIGLVQVGARVDLQCRKSGCKCRVAGVVRSDGRVYDTTA